MSKDRLTKERRSWNMSRIRGKNTTPEKSVRSLLHRLDYRFRLHVRIPVAPVYDRRHLTTGKSDAHRATLQSQPRAPKSVSVDILLPQYRTAIFVHGCFWHRHRGCRNCTTPTNRREWWLAKLNGNAARDKLHQKALRQLGWRVIVVWECETESPKSRRRLIAKLARLRMYSFDEFSRPA